MGPHLVPRDGRNADAIHGGRAAAAGADRARCRLCRVSQFSGGDDRAAFGPGAGDADVRALFCRRDVHAAVRRGDRRSVDRAQDGCVAGRAADDGRAFRDGVRCLVPARAAAAGAGRGAAARQPERTGQGALRRGRPTLGQCVPVLLSGDQLRRVHRPDRGGWCRRDLGLARRVRDRRVRDADRAGGLSGRPASPGRRKAAAVAPDRGTRAARRSCGRSGSR